MNSSTLRGVFPEPKPIHRRNFVRENIKSLKEMRSFVNEPKESRHNKFKGLRSKLSRPISYNQIGVQTERPEDIGKLSSGSTVKSPSPHILNKAKLSPHRTTEHGDVEQMSQSMKKLDLDEKHNFIKQNIKNIRANKQKLETSNPLLPPTGYQKGVLPKYLKDKKDSKESKSTEFEGDNVDGLILLPDDERKEYLRVARENYAALIKELNSMPVSNDTLKKRKRKIEIEDELKRLDEVIKVFQKPKVFVKSDA